VEVLEGMGVLEPVRSELAGLEWATEDYLDRWARWLGKQAGLPAGRQVGVGLVVTQVRAGVEAPESERERYNRRMAEGWIRAGARS